MAKQLNNQQKCFLKYYLGDACFNATEAAKKAKYSEKTAYSQGQRLLKHVEIKKIIEKAVNVSEEFIKEKMLLGLTIAENRKNTTAMARFLELMCRIKGMLKDNVNVTDTQRQRELDEKEKVEVDEIAKVRLRKFKI